MSRPVWTDLSELTEHDLRTKIRIPLLNRTVGVSQVTDVHGTNDRGLDSIFFTVDSFPRTCYGIQVKKGDISGGGRGAQTVKVIIDQLGLAEGFGHPVAVPLPREYASKVSGESLILLMSQPIRQAILWPVRLRLLYLEALTPHRIWVL